MLSSYFIEIKTGVDYSVDTYDAAAGRMTAMLVSILSDPGHMNALTHDEPRESCHSEVEVSLEEVDGCMRELIAKVVVDITADNPVKFDKSKWTKLIKARPEADEWKKMKIFKRQVPILPEAPSGAGSSGTAAE